MNLESLKKKAFRVFALRDNLEKSIRMKRSEHRIEREKEHA